MRQTGCKDPGLCRRGEDRRVYCQCLFLSSLCYSGCSVGRLSRWEEEEEEVISARLLETSARALLFRTCSFFFFFSFSSFLCGVRGVGALLLVGVLRGKFFECHYTGVCSYCSSVEKFSEKIEWSCRGCWLVSRWMRAFLFKKYKNIG